MQLREMPDLGVRVQILKALADEARLDIIRVLYICGKEMTCTSIGEEMGNDDGPVPNSTLSYHLRLLREAGLTSTRKVAQNRLISLRYETFEQYLLGFLETLK